jgi:hypothetical protein
MDYNFYVSQNLGGEISFQQMADKYNAVYSKKKTAQDVRRDFKAQMLDSYLLYFKNNYEGNRAPLSIGHHFSMWNDGIYWEAMMEFTERVCGLPEVQCVTNEELKEALEKEKPETLLAYQSSSFEKNPSLRFAQSWESSPVEVMSVFADTDTGKLSLGMGSVSNLAKFGIKYKGEAPREMRLSSDGIYYLSTEGVDPELKGDMPQAHCDETDGEICSFLER